MNALTICVNYGDYLALTLPHNRQYFDRYLVVTDHEDLETPAICRANEVEYHQTSAFYGHGQAFAKGAALKEGIEVLGLDGWTTILDADIAIPLQFWAVVYSEDSLPKDMIFGPQEKCHCQKKEVGSNIHNNGTSCAGFLQVFHGPSYERNVGIDHPSTTGHCGLDDILFSRCFPRVGYFDFKVCHLGPVPKSGKANADWKGRVSDKCPFEAKDVPILAGPCTREF